MTSWYVDHRVCCCSLRASSLVVYVVAAQADEKAVSSESLCVSCQGYEVENVRDQELLVPLRDRAVAPVLHRTHEPGPSLHP